MKILVGYDGTNPAKEAVNLAKSHAKAFDASVEVVTSMQKGTESEQKDIEQAERGLAYAKSLFDEDNIACGTQMKLLSASNADRKSENCCWALPLNTSSCRHSARW